MTATEHDRPDLDAVPQPGWPAEIGLVGMSVAAAIGMGRLFADASFLPVVLLAVAVSHGLSMACRRRGVGPLSTLAVSVVGLVLFVTWVVEPHVSLLPGPATWNAAVGDLRDAWGRFSEVVAPAKVTRGFVLGAALGSWIAAFVADLFAFRARTRVEAVVPSFAVFLFGALLGAERHRLSAALIYLAAVLAFVVLAEMAAAARPRPWLAGRRGAGESALLRSGLAMAAVTVVVAVVVGPQLPGAYAKGILGVGDGPGRKTGTRITLSPLVDIQGKLLSQSTVELFTVKTDTPSYWRITALDRFNGDIWSSLSNYRPAGTRLPAVGPDARLGPHDQVDPGVRDRRPRLDLAARGLPPQSLSPSGKVRFDPDSGSLATDKATSDGLKYTVVSALPELTAADLNAVTGAPPADIAGRYLDLHPNVSPRGQGHGAAGGRQRDVALPAGQGAPGLVPQQLQVQPQCPEGPRRQRHRPVPAGQGGVLRAVRGHLRGHGPGPRPARPGGRGLHRGDPRGRRPAPRDRQGGARLARGLPERVRVGGLRTDAHARAAAAPRTTRVSPRPRRPIRRR